MGTRLANKVALVFGAGSSAGGLSNGSASTILMAREGAKIFAADINLAAMEDMRGELDASGAEYAFAQCDVSSASDVARVVAACIERFGRIDVLFNNVGIQAVGGPLDITEETFDRLMDVNVKGMFLACQAVLPHMLKKGGGSIVNNASLASIRYSYPSIAYSASKGAVTQLTQSIGLQYAAKNIRCNAVLPGYIATNRIVNRFKESHGEGYVDKIREREEQVPAGKLGDPWDIGYAVLYLASDEAKYVNGIGLIVDGGLSSSTTGRISEA